MNLNEQLNRIKTVMGLNESLTDEIYHFTSFRSLNSILKTNQFLTTAAVASPSDMKFNKGKYFFFSTTRSKATGYTQGNTKLVLNGRKLNQKYKSTAIDYWQYSKNRKDYNDDNTYKMALASPESEDRIITNEPFINNAISYINEIHVYIYPDIKVYQDTLTFIKETCQNNNIGLYFYDTKENWLLQNKTKQVDPEKTFKIIDPDDINQKTYEPKPAFYRYSDLGVLLAFNDQTLYNKVLELIDQEDIEKFENYYEDQTYKYLNKNAPYDYEAARLFTSRISNNKSNPDNTVRQLFKLLADDMRKKNVTTIKDYIEVKQNQPPISK